MKPAKTKYEKGFTLVEVLVASMLLTVAMVPVLRALAASHTLSRRVEYKTQSLVHAKAKLDWIKAESIYNFDNDFTENSTLIEGRYLVTVADDDISNPDLRQITVYVGYDSDDDLTLDNDEVEVGLRTLIARRWN